MTSFTKMEAAATRKLEGHYAKLGFIKVKGTPYMVRSGNRPLMQIEN